MSQSKFTASFLLVTLALFIWSAGFLISISLSGSTIELSESSADSADFEQLVRAVKNSPDDARARLELAARAVEKGYRDGDGRLVLVGLENYSAILQKDPDNTHALLGVASVSFRSEVYEKALEYYRRYLELEPQDDKTKVDLGLTLVSLGRADEAADILRDVLTRDSEMFTARLALGLAYKQAQKPQEAREQILEALHRAPSDDTRNYAQDLLNNLYTQTETVGQDPADIISPAGIISSFFREHIIIGPKPKRLYWENPNKAVVVVEDFEIRQMSVSAKDGFVSSIETMLRSLPIDVVIEIRDANNQSLIYGSPNHE